MSETKRRLATIMFSDMVGYSALAQNDETLAIELLNEHRSLLRRIFDQHGGRENDAVGDGFFVEFSSAVDAVRCAIEIQKTLRERNAQVDEHRRIDVRIGLHVGDVIVEGTNVLGDGVNIAARIQQTASPGCIHMTEDVARMVHNKVQLPVDAMGVSNLKNIAKPVNVFKLRLPWEPAPVPTVVSVRADRSKMLWPMALGVLLLVLGVIAYQWQERTVPVSGLNNRIAVLPFTSLSPDNADEYFADGITEEMISRLSRMREVEVIARTSMMSYKGTRKKISEIGKELNAGTVLEGSVRKAGDKLRITAQLVRTDSEAHLWSDTYDQELKDALSIQKSIAERVASAMAPVLGAARAETYVPRMTTNVEAYDEYLKGRYHANKSSLEGIREGIRHFERAIALDQDFAMAHAALAEAYVQLPFQDDVFAAEAHPKARVSAQRAIQLDDSLAEGHAMVAVVSAFADYDWNAADRGFRRALALNPNSSTTYWWYSWYLMFLRQFDDGVEAMRRSVHLDPLSIAKNTDLGWVYQFAGKWDASVEQLRKTLDMDKSNVLALGAYGWAFLGSKKYKEAHVAFDREAKAYGREPWVLTDIINAYALEGSTDKAVDVLGELAQAKSTVSGWTGAVSRFGLALGDENHRRDMYQWMDRAVEERSFWLVHTSNAWWTDFHADPRWVRFRGKMKLPP